MGRRRLVGLSSDLNVIAADRQRADSMCGLILGRKRAPVCEASTSHF